MERENKRTLENGILMYSYKNPSLNGFYISLYLRAGCMYEPEGDVGITHFLEHIAIRNVNAEMGGTLYSLLDRYGIEFNASTYNDMVQFYVSGARKNFEIGSRILAKILSPIVLSADEIRTEGGRIKAEIRENDERGSLANFTSSIVFEGTPLSRMITGSVSGVSAINGTRLEKYRRSVFNKDNIFLYVTGSFDDGDLDALAELVGACELYPGVANDNVAELPEKFFKRDGTVHIKNADYTMVRFTFDMDMSKISYAESDILYDTLLGGYNSRFFIEMSEKEGLFYDLCGSCDRYKNIGTLSFYYEVKPSQIYTAIERTLDILRSFVTSPLTDEECMKAGYVDNAYMLYDDARELNFTFAYDNHILDAGYGSIDERIAAYSAVTPERIAEIADMLFRPENLILTLKGRRKKIDKEKIESLIRSFADEKN